MITLSRIALPLGLLLGLASSVSHAQDSYCRFQDGGGGPVTFERNLNTVFMPRDAVVGNAFFDAGRSSIPTNERRTLECWNGGQAIMRFSLIPTRPPLPLAIYSEPGQILPTNIPGIGARIQLISHFNSEAGADFRSEDGHNWVPFNAVRDTQHQVSAFNLISLINRVILVRTGPVDPGIHQIDAEMFRGHLDFDNIGDAFRYRLRAEVIQSQCSVGADAVTPNPVPLGEFSRSDFTHVGYTTPKVDFQITLSACQTDPDQNAFATLELDGKNGSLPIGPIANGVFSLTADSDAAGVGIQVFKQDGRPMPLQTEEQMVPLSTGNTVLNLSASFHQTEDSHAVRAGLAKGALNFVVRYR